MTKKLKSITFALASLVMLGGCLNMPTPPSQITGSYTSGLRYENFDCSRLSAELDSLARRENQLVIAQEQRIKSSQMQGCLWGFGQGDGDGSPERFCKKADFNAPSSLCRFLFGRAIGEKFHSFWTAEESGL